MGNDSSLCCYNTQTDILQDNMFKQSTEYDIEKDNYNDIYEIIFQKTNIIYRGQLYNNIPHGKGIEIHPQGDTYQGNFYHGVKHGTGTYKFSSGDIYHGGFSNNAIEGHGYMFFSNGDSYQGEFKNNLLHGQGTYRSHNRKQQYEGQYYKGKKHGQGVLYINGVTHRGKWSHGLYCSK